MTCCFISNFDCDTLKNVIKVLAIPPGIQTASKVAVNGSRDCEHEYGGGEQRAALSVQLTKNCEQDDEEDHHGQLGPDPHKRGEEEGTGGRAEDVSVNLFPAVLVTEVPLHVVNIVLLAVPGVVTSEGPHQDHSHQTNLKSNYTSLMIIILHVFTKIGLHLEMITLFISMRGIPCQRETVRLPIITCNN